jgi:DNA-binding CsgD family transcriptional regulator
MLTVFQEPTSAQFPFPFSEFKYLAWFGPLLVMTITSVSIALWFKRTRIVFNKIGYQIAISSLMVLGSVFHALWSLGVFAGTLSGNIAIFIFQAVLIGTSAAFFRIEIDRIFGYLGATQTLSLAMAGICLGTILTPLLSSILPYLWLGVSIILPFLLILALRKVLAKVASPRYYAHGLESELFIPYKFLFTSFFQGIAFGIMCGGTLILGTFSQGWFAGTASRVIGLAIVFGAVLFMKLNFDRWLYKIGFPLVAVGFILLACLPESPEFGGIIAWAGYCYLDIILWSLGAYLMKNAGLPATWIATFPGAALTGGTLIGGLIGWLAASQDSAGLILFAGLTACMLLAVALFLSSGQNIKYGWGTIKPDGDTSSESLFADACAYLSAENKLTKRETEVLFLTAQGYSRKKTSLELNVSTETVKTHIQSVYRKLLIHSQDELREMVKSAEHSLGHDEV